MLSALRKVIKKYSAVSVPQIPPNNGKQGYGNIEVKKLSSLFDVLHTISNSEDVVESKNPVFMESVGQVNLNYVFIYPLSW